MNPSDNQLPVDARNPSDWLHVVRKKVANLQYGSVVVTIHDGRVTQVESIEKTRIVTAPTDKPTLKTS
ncbi:MAG: YezD family protein [Luteolibacter sp.]